jgi:hypothetical protein
MLGCACDQILDAIRIFYIKLAHTGRTVEFVGVDHESFTARRLRGTPVAVYSSRDDDQPTIMIYGHSLESAGLHHGIAEAIK